MVLRIEVDIMKDDILKILGETDKSLTVFEIEEKLGTNNLEELLKVLKELEVETLVYHTNKDKYMLFKDSHLLKGILHSNKKGFGFVDVDNSDVDIYISKENHAQRIAALPQTAKTFGPHEHRASGEHHGRTRRTRIQ